MGLGVIASGASHVIEEMFLVAAKALASEVSEGDLEHGSLYPPLSRIREVPATIAAAVGEVAYQRDLATKPKPDDILGYIKSLMYEPKYQSYV